MFGGSIHNKAVTTAAYVYLRCGSMTNQIMKITVLSLLLLASGLNYAVADTSSVKIIRDTYGVPHIYADDTYSLFYGYGYAVGQDRLFQMEMVKRTTSGRVAEVLGQEYLKIDITVRQGFDPQSLHKQIEALSEQELAAFKGYAAGLNKWIDEVKNNPTELMPKEFNDFGFTPSIWTAYDVLLVIAGSMAHRYADFNEEINNLGFYQDLKQQHGADKAWQIFNATLPIYDKSSPVTVPDRDARKRKIRYRGERRPGYLDDMQAASLQVLTPLAFEANGQHLNIVDDQSRQSYIQKHLTESGIPGIAGFSSASNVWLVNSKKTKNAKGLLVNGPQFGWINPSYVYGVGLHGAGFNVVGNTLFAYPFMLFAHNGDISWGSTAGFGDLVDIYVSKLNPKNAEEYFYKGSYHPLSKRSEEIEIKGQQAEQHTFYRTHYGPVILIDESAGLIYSKKRSWEGHEVETSVAWVELARQKDFKSWRKQLSRMATNINFYYLDKKGNIGYTHTGKYPVRKNGHDNRLPALGDGSLDWQSYLPFKKNPHVYNPAQGYITNWNNRPEHNWPNSDLWWRRWGKAERVDILISELEAKDKFTSEELWDINSRSSFADVNLRYLLPVLKKALADKASAKIVEDSLQTLEQWDGYWWDKNEDGTFDGGAAPMIMQTWLTKLSSAVLKDDVGDKYYFRFASPGYPVNAVRASIPVSAGIKTIVNTLDQMDNNLPVDYDFFNGQKPAKILSRTFINTVNELSDKFGAKPGLWKLKPHPQIFAAFNFRGVAQTTKDNEMSLPVIMNRGTENNLFVAKDNTIQGWDVFAPGQSGFIAPDGSKSPHYDDQLDMYWHFKNKPLPFSLKQVKGMQETEVVLEIENSSSH
jgi:penicillin G amidase